MQPYVLTPRSPSSEKPVALALATTVDAINPIEGDLLLTNGQLGWLGGAAAKVQQIRSCLSFIYGEWFLNTAEGVPYIEQVLLKGVADTAVAAVFKKALAKVPGVQSVDSVKVTSDRRTRTATVVWAVTLTTGDTLADSYGPFDLTGR